MIPVHKGGEISSIAFSDLHQVTGALYVPSLYFADFNILRKITQTTAGLQKTLDQEKKWLCAYFQKEVLANKLPDVSLRWINDEIGWGVFAERDFTEMEYIAEYTGIVRKARRTDNKNPYCFSYPLIPGEKTRFIIDAMDQGGISRYINHDFEPNLVAAMINVAGINHIIIYTQSHIPKDTQICYNYGPDYWNSRKKPEKFS